MKGLVFLFKAEDGYNLYTYSRGNIVQSMKQKNTQSKSSKSKVVNINQPYIKGKDLE